MRRIYIVATGTTVDAGVRATAAAQSCSEIAVGVPAALVGIVNPVTLPTVYVEADVPDDPDFVLVRDWMRDANVKAYIEATPAQLAALTQAQRDRMSQRTAEALRALVKFIHGELKA